MLNKILFRALVAILLLAGAGIPDLHHLASADDSILLLPSAPILNFPPDGAGLQSLGTSLSWINPPAITQLQIRVTPANGNGPSINLIIGDAAQVSTATYAVVAPALGAGNYLMLPAMTYSWQVRAAVVQTPLLETDVLWGPWSQPRRFATPWPSTSGLSPVSPPDRTTVTEQELDLQWQNSASDIFYYEVQVSRDPQFRTGPNSVAEVWWNLVHGGVTSPLDSWHTPQLQPSTTYYWRVRPRVESSATGVAWGPVWRFTTAGASGSIVAYEQEVLARINQVRQSFGLVTLQQDDQITAAARLHSADMAEHNSMSHTGSDGSDPGQRLRNSDYIWRAYGEIVAYGYSTPEAVVAGWMNSPSHREVILMPDFRDFGSGLVFSSSGRPYWTVDFGLRLGQ